MKTCSTFRKKFWVLLFITRWASSIHQLIVTYRTSSRLSSVKYLSTKSSLFPLSFTLFLFHFIFQVEEYKCEIHNDLLETHTGLMCKSSQQDGEGFKTYVINEAITMSLKEKASIISDGTTGLCTWQAAFYLAEWCIQHAEFFREKTVIELGSGSGLVGLTCLKMCRPKSVTLTDHHSKVLESLQCNVQINNHSQRESTDTHVQVRSLDWIEFSQNKDTLDADIVLASGW